MTLIFRYLSTRMLAAIAMSLVSLLLLFSFFDYIDELGTAGNGGYTATRALLHVFLKLPMRFQELMPVAALIGALFTLARLAANSEFTVMRASGLSALRLLGFLGGLGLALSVLIFAVGEYLTPVAENLARQVKVRSTHQVVAREFRSGLWAKDGSKFINIRQFLKDGRLGDIRVYEFDTGFELRAILHAGTGAWLRPGAWRLEQVTQTRLVEGRIAVTRHAELDWASSLSPTLLSALVVDPEHMALSDLSTYIAYLKHNQQQTARYELALWNKLAFPLAAPVMLFLALPFGYQPPRSHAIGGRILVGILIGMGFHMLTRMSGHVGLLNEWPAPLSAMLPTVLVTLVALAALWRVERR